VLAATDAQLLFVERRNTSADNDGTFPDIDFHALQRADTTLMQKVPYPAVYIFIFLVHVVIPFSWATGRHHLAFIAQLSRMKERVQNR
jgi:hypothetical protein